MALGLTPREILKKGEYCLLAAGPHWERVPLGEIADVQNGAAFKSKYFTHGDGLPLIRIRDVGKTETDNHYDGPYDDEYLVYPGDIIIGMDGDFKVAKWPGEVGLLNQRVCRLKLKSPCIDQDFLFYCLQPFLDAINAETSSVTVKHLSSRTVSEIPLPLPPLDEQRRIVAKFEELFSELDKGVESLKTARAQLKTYRQSLLKAAFEGRLTEQWRRDNADKLETAEQLLQRIREEREARYRQQLEEWGAAVEEWKAKGMPDKQPRKPAKFKELSELSPEEISDLPEIPSLWKWVRLGLCAERITVGHVGSMKNEYVDDGVPFLRSLNVRPNRFDPSELRYVSERFHRSLKKSSLRPGDVVVVRSGTVGTACVIPDSLGEANCSDLVIVKGLFYVLPDLVAHYMNWQAEGRVKSHTVGVALSHFNTKSVETFPFPLMSSSEQEILMDSLESRLTQVEQMEESIESGLQQSEALRQSILKRAFEGKLIPQDPDDEPASALLERIRQEQADALKPKRRKRKAGATV